MIPSSIEPTEDSDRVIAMTRVLDAPRELVWKVWTTSDHLGHWWGPQGFTTTTSSHDCRAGGVWRYVMHGPDGRDYENKITYLEVVAPERLSYKHGGDQDLEPVNFHVTVQFLPEGPGGNKTRLEMRMLFPSKSAREFVIREYNAVEGGKQTMARLGEYLQGLVASGKADPADRPFVYTRVLRAPVDRVWNAWTDRDALLGWFGPKGTTISQARLELSEGGRFHYGMPSDNGQMTWGRWVFQKIVPNQRIESLVSFSDEQGGVTRAPFNADWPLETASVVTFAEHAGIGRGTVVTVEWSVKNGTVREREAFAASHESMTQGWTGTFDQLAEYLGQA